jgi:hypothetical protein
MAEKQKTPPNVAVRKSLNLSENKRVLSPAYRYAGCSGKKGVKK